MIRPADSKPSRTRALATRLAPLIAFAGCSGPAPEPPPAPPAPAVTAPPATKAVQPGGAGYSGKASGGVGR